jgi:CheY-like chemotaxis protein
MATTAKTAAQRRPILVVEDSDEDYAAFLRAFQKMPVVNPVYRCKDGDDCLDYLYKSGIYTNKNPLRPSLLLLDLNLPGTDGREVLEKVEADVQLKTIPIVVVTTSTSPEDVELCYRSGANSYVTKSHDWPQFEGNIRMLLDYWFTAAVLP